MTSLVQISNVEPIIPDDAEFAIYINFAKNEPNPQRIFQAADMMIQSMQKLDKVLCGLINTNLTTVMLLEDVEQGSLKIWLKSVLEKIPDDGLKNLDWKKAIGYYLVKAKYICIKKLENKENITELPQELHNLAKETDILNIPAYNYPSLEDLKVINDDISTAKSYLSKHDNISYLLKNGEKAEFNLNTYVDFEDLLQSTIAQTIETKMDMIFAVKKPDYLGDSKWQLRWGKKSISASIDDLTWLSDFQNRRVNVRPGDSIKCETLIHYNYGHDNELIGECYTILKVIEVLELPIQQNLLE
jgi:hypothetical protein